MAIRLEGKRANEVRDYRHDWSGFLGTDTIVSQVTSADGATLDSSTNDTTSVTMWVSGGTDGVPATITQTIVTTDGRTETETFTLQITLGEPVSLAEAKAQCRVLDDSEDALIASYIVAAREWVENYTGHIMVRRTITEQRDAFTGYIELRHRPVVSVTSIGYTDGDGVPATYLGYTASASRNPARVYPALNGSWPTLGTNGEVTVVYVAGYAEGEVPASLTHAILLLVGFWFANREAVNVGNITSELPLGVDALIQTHRRVMV